MSCVVANDGTEGVVLQKLAVMLEILSLLYRERMRLKLFTELQH